MSKNTVRIRDEITEAAICLLPLLFHSHLASQRREHVRELQSDVPRSHDAHVLGYVLEVEGSVRGVDSLLVDGHAGGDEGEGAGGKDYVLGSVDLERRGGRGGRF
jgi:hypothetical protein